MRIVISLLAVLAFGSHSLADDHCNPPLPESVCTMVSRCVSDIDSICLKYPNDDTLRQHMLDQVRERFYQQVMAIKYPCNVHSIDLLSAAGNYNSWSNKILWGKQPGSPYLSDVASWELERKASLERLKIFCPNIRASNPAPVSDHGSIKGLTFTIVERTYAHDSLQTHKDLQVAASLEDEHDRSGFESILKEYIARKRVLVLPAGSKVTLTGRAAGMAAEVTIGSHPGKWCIPVKALKDAGVPVPPVDFSYMSEQLKK